MLCIRSKITHKQLKTPLEVYHLRRWKTWNEMECYCWY